MGVYQAILRQSSNVLCNRSIQITHPAWCELHLGSWRAGQLLELGKSSVALALLKDAS